MPSWNLCRSFEEEKGVYQGGSSKWVKNKKFTDWLLNQEIVKSCLYFVELHSCPYFPLEKLTFTTKFKIRPILGYESFRISVRNWLDSLLFLSWAEEFFSTLLDCYLIDILSQQLVRSDVWCVVQI
jgi:hypothetical protein